MAKITLDIASLKSAGVYTYEYDNSIRSNTIEATTLRLLVGFNPKGVFNRPVLVTSDTVRERLFGSFDTKLEHKGCFFNRFAQTLLRKGPFLALNLLKTDETENGPDQVNFAAMSLNAGTPNPEVISAGKYGEFDYLDKLDASIYGDKTTYIPYIGKTPFASLFDRSRFWQVSEHNLTAVAANKLQTGDTTSFEHTNFLNFSNCGTDEISILVYKPENLSGYNITAAEWYNGAENIPYGWIRPSDYIADYFLTVICVKGNWSNSPALNTDPIWYSYFDKYGLLKSKINSFCGAEGVNLLGIWTGCIIPDFVDKQGNSQALLQKVNNNTEVTGLLMSLNEDALQVLNYDYNGSADEGEETGSGCWFYDIDGDNQMSVNQGESPAGMFTIDMVGHDFQKGIRTDGSADSSVELDSSFVFSYGANNTSLYYLPTFDNVKSANGSKASLLTNSLTPVQDGTVILNSSAFQFGADYLVVAEETADPDKIKAGDSIINETTIVGTNEATTLKLNYSLQSNDDKLSVVFNIAPTSIQKNTIDASTFDLLNEIKFEITGIKKGEADVSLGDASLGFVYTKEKDASDITFEYELNKSYSEIINDFNYVSINLKLTLPENPSTITTIPTDIANKELASGSELITSINGIDKKSSNTYAIATVSSGNISTKYKVPYGTYISVVPSTAGTDYNYTLYKLYSKGTTKSNKTTYNDAVEVLSSSSVAIVEENFNDNIFTFDYPIIGNQKVEYVFTNVYSPTKDDKFSGVATALNSGENNKIYGIDFLSYNYVANTSANVVSTIKGVELFNNASIFSNNGVAPVGEDTYNIFAITDKDSAANLVVGDYVNNIAFNNEDGVAVKYNTIPGITRVTSKVFVNVVASDSTFTYKGNTYNYSGSNLIIDTDYGVRGFYLYTTIDGIDKSNITHLDYALYKNVKDKITPKNGVALNDYTKLYPISSAGDGVYDRYELANGVDVVDIKADEKTTDKNALTDSTNAITKQLPISDNTISRSLRFIPLKGLKITGRHRPGYDENGNIDIEGGIEKVYSMIEDEGILRGLCNPEMADFRYIVDSMSYGVRSELGGKVHLARAAKAKGKCLAILNMPSVRQFTNSQNPYFCDTYVNGSQIKPAFNTKYIPQGGNAELYATNVFSLPSEDNGSKFSAAFFPHLKYSYNNKTILVPPAADVANTLVNKFTSGDPYMICANLNGILNNPSITGVEYIADQTDRDYLEPFGVNTIITRNDNVMIYANQTCYQTVKSDLNKLHIRENLNTIEIAVDNALQDFVFEYNNAATRAAIVSKITPYFNNMLISGAIESYNIVCDETNNTADIIEEDILIVDTEVQFTHGAEKIVHRITVNRVGSTSD